MMDCARVCISLANALKNWNNASYYFLINLSQKFLNDILGYTVFLKYSITMQIIMVNRRKRGGMKNSIRRRKARKEQAIKLRVSCSYKALPQFYAMCDIFVKHIYLRISKLYRALRIYYLTEGIYTALNAFPYSMTQSLYSYLVKFWFITYKKGR